MAKLARYLVQRDSGFYARIAVPERLRSFIGKKELWSPVKAESVPQANKRVHAVIAPMMAQIEDARALLGNDPASYRKPRDGQKLSTRQIATTFYADELAADQSSRMAVQAGLAEFDSDWWLQDHIERLTKIASGRSADPETNAIIGWAIDALRAKGHTNVILGSEEWRELAKQLAAVRIEALKRKTERDAGDFNGKPSHPLLIKPAAISGDDPLAARCISPDSTKSLSDLMPDYIRERGADARTDYDSRVTVRIFEEHIGEKKPVYRITRDDTRTFKEALIRTPTNYRKKFGEVTMTKAIELNGQRKEPFPCLNPKTINDKYLAKLHSFLNWCVNNDLIPDNPAKGRKVETVKMREKPRTNFTPSDLGKIFAPATFKPEGTLDEFQWALLVSLFAGTRASELAQLKLDSIRHHGDVLMIDIEETTKTIGSQRRIPVHPKLIELGFKKRVDALRKAKETHFFPEWFRKGTTSRKRKVESGGTLQQETHFSRFIPRVFINQYLPKVGIDDPRKIFHSFRHTFLTGLVECGVDEEMRKALGGHADYSPAAGYVHGFSVERLNEAIKKLKLDGFTL